jgi:hypothetical protein
MVMNWCRGALKSTNKFLIDYFFCFFAADVASNSMAI